MGDTSLSKKNWWTGLVLLTSSWHSVQNSALVNQKTELKSYLWIITTSSTINIIWSWKDVIITSDLEQIKQTWFEALEFTKFYLTEILLKSRILCLTTFPFFKKYLLGEEERKGFHIFSCLLYNLYFRNRFLLSRLGDENDTIWCRKFNVIKKNLFRSIIIPFSCFF